MDIVALRQELHDFYLNGTALRAERFARRCFSLLDAQAAPDMTVMQQIKGSVCNHAHHKCFSFISGLSATFGQMAALPQAGCGLLHRYD